MPALSSLVGSQACETSSSPGPAPPQDDLPGTGTWNKIPPTSKKRRIKECYINSYNYMIINMLRKVMQLFLTCECRFRNSSVVSLVPA